MAQIKWMVYGIIFATLILSLCVGCQHQPSLQWPAQLILPTAAEAKITEEQLGLLGGMAQELNEAVDGGLFTTGHSRARVIIELVDTFSGQTDDKYQVVGRAHISNNQCIVQLWRPMVQRLAMLVVWHDGAFHTLLSPSILQTILWHEIGHCTGLEHPPEDVQSEIMSFIARSFMLYEQDAIDSFIHDVKTMIYKYQ